MTYEKLVKYSKNIELFVKICYHLFRQIRKLRTKLNNSIIKGEDYDKIYRLSVELDELIAKYYITQSMKKQYHKRERKSESIKLRK